MTQEDWGHRHARALGVYVVGAALQERDARGRPVFDDNFLVLFNAHHKPQRFRLPLDGGAVRWRVLLDTTLKDGPTGTGTFRGGASYAVAGRALALLEQQKSTP
jgi:glycogen operon protein